ncbi:MAG: L-threonylcarbamoyladenylate synthase [Bacteroidales bacterium]|jgi:L-threonylcarbamoyladenylate synthase|nr:L-threonylcarbamoyladenylate synthase [Bacteroidales bacterium]MDD3104915.1 L-threonylcarbamoyladenylate synthase [Bacteroidales bacterium]MDD3549442.1 L-threonylcarbamoyladenylate synthase [Bacteroidales bacterium]MDD4064251.1 L-threonylcarbamoyladenylate synthase [Bacteroidales bacterium]MDD5283182.1 L-threonylcarbamoyladenylate synthase [Bacteroidales bacterium]
MKDNRDIYPHVEKAGEILRTGGTILYPTDTVWGIGCDACNEKAVQKVTEIKNRPAVKNYIVLAADLNMVSRYVERIPSMAEELLEVADKPLTIIYPWAMNLAPGVAAPDGSVAFRIPDQRFCRALIRNLKRPLLSTSANISGAKAPMRFSEIDPALIRKIDWTAPRFLEENATGKPSSIIRLGPNNEVEIIRP